MVQLNRLERSLVNESETAAKKDQVHSSARKGWAVLCGNVAKPSGVGGQK